MALRKARQIPLQPGSVHDPDHVAIEAFACGTFFRAQMRMLEFEGEAVIRPHIRNMPLAPGIVLDDFLPDGRELTFPVPMPGRFRLPPGIAVRTPRCAQWWMRWSPHFDVMGCPQPGQAPVRPDSASRRSLFTNAYRMDSPYVEAAAFRAAARLFLLNGNHCAARPAYAGAVSSYLRRYGIPAHRLSGWLG